MCGHDYQPPIPEPRPRLRAHLDPRPRHHEFRPYRTCEFRGVCCVCNQPERRHWSIWRRVAAWLRGE